MIQIEDTYEVRNRAYTPNEVESSREPSPAHLYENPILQKNKSNKCLIIGLFIITNINHILNNLLCCLSLRSLGSYLFL